MSIHFKSPRLSSVLAVLFCALTAATVRAQSYSIDWYKVSGGGGASTNAQYSLNGTIGQPDAGSGMTGGNYVVTGGFWSIYAVQAPGAPVLLINKLGTNRVIISWDASITGFTLQTNANLTTGVWSNYTGVVVNNTATNSPPKGNVFFRLKH